MQKKFGSHTGWLSYTINKVQDRFPELQADPFAASQDQRHEVKLVDSLRRGPWTFSGAFVLASGAPYTEATEVESTSIGEEFVFDRLVSGTRHAARLPGYQRLDLAVHYELQIGPGKGTLGVSGFNVYNHTNVWYREFQVGSGCWDGKGDRAHGSIMPVLPGGMVNHPRRWIRP